MTPTLGRPLPAWFDDAKLGIFIHSGFFASIPYAEWYRNCLAIEGGSVRYTRTPDAVYAVIRP